MRPECTNQNYEDLVRLNLINSNTIELFSSSTRDNANLPVYRDRRSEVVFIRDKVDSFQCYQSQRATELFGSPYLVDSKRLYNVQNRANEAKHFYVGKDVLDFGCGCGDFILHIRGYAKSVSAIEIGSREIEHLRSNSIRCESSYEAYDEHSFDTVFAFHVIEHLESQIEYLRGIRSRLRPDGRLYLEVPHARDFLLVGIGSSEFKDFTLWSQHLVLHTRNSLMSFLMDAGYKSIEVFGIQRYPLSNHFCWLRNGKPSGHNGIYSYLDTLELTGAYEAALQRCDRTDTLVAIASV